MSHRGHDHNTACSLARVQRRLDAWGQAACGALLLLAVESLVVGA